MPGCQPGDPGSKLWPLRALTESPEGAFIHSIYIIFSHCYKNYNYHLHHLILIFGFNINVKVKQITSADGEIKRIKGYKKPNEKKEQM